MARPGPNKRKLAVAQRRKARELRNHAIVQAYLDYDTREKIAARFGITPRQVTNIVREAGATMSSEQLNYGNRLRAFIMPCGRRCLPLEGADLNTYEKARRYYGAAEARRIMGIC